MLKIFFVNPLIYFTQLVSNNVFYKKYNKSSIK